MRNFRADSAQGKHLAARRSWVPSTVLLGIVCALLAGSGILLWGTLGPRRAGLHSGGLLPTRNLLWQWTQKHDSIESQRSQPIRKKAMKVVFGTMFQSELHKNFGLHNDTNGEGLKKLIASLKGMEAHGFNQVVFSISWEFLQPAEATYRWAYFDTFMNAACQNTGLKAALIFDMLHAPAWVHARHTDAKVYDAGGRVYATYLSTFHGQAQALALGALQLVAQRMSTKYTGCAVSIQPTYNNEYEAKYTQEYDSYQDYSAPALKAYRSWLQSRNVSLVQVNNRWSSSFATWADVMPPKLYGGSVRGLEDSPSVLDWLRFRVLHGAGVFNRACAAVKAAGLQCFHHFPEFFSVIDAIYGASMFKHIAASPDTDYVIMDSNFRTPYGTVMDPVKLRLYISAAVPYGKAIFFEAAVERFKENRLLRDGYANALLAGAENVGITNWLQAGVGMDDSLRSAIRDASPTCETTERVAVFIHLDSCSAWHGLQWQTSTPDPMHVFTERLAERLTKSCGTDIVVFIELDRFIKALPSYHRAVFVEPLLLYGRQELDLYGQAKMALRTLPHEVLEMPTNSSRGLALRVLQEL